MVGGGSVRRLAGVRARTSRSAWVPTQPGGQAGGQACGWGSKRVGKRVGGSARGAHTGSGAWMHEQAGWQASGRRPAVLVGRGAAAQAQAHAEQSQATAATAVCAFTGSTP